MTFYQPHDAHPATCSRFVTRLQVFVVQNQPTTDKQHVEIKVFSAELTTSMFTDEKPAFLLPHIRDREGFIIYFQSSKILQGGNDCTE